MPEVWSFMGKVDLKIDWATYEAAKYAVEHWHYSRCMPGCDSVKLGVWEDMIFKGVIIFSRGATNKSNIPYGIKTTEICELTRVALKEHATPVTRMIKIAIIKLKQHCPSLRLIVSYADSEHGHSGGIYQGGGWIYEGESRDSNIIVNGIRKHRRSLGSKYGTNSLEWIRKNIDPEAQRIKTKAKYKYLMPLDEEMRKQIEPLSKPYPKRDKQAIGGDHPHSGGAAPTVTLQTKRPKQAMTPDQGEQRRGSADPDAPEIAR